MIGLNNPIVPRAISCGISLQRLITGPKVCVEQFSRPL